MAYSVALGAGTGSAGNVGAEILSSSPLHTSSSPAKALQEISARQLSGRVLACDPDEPEVGWYLQVGNGQVHFASSTTGQRDRLAYLLGRYCPHLGITVPTVLGAGGDYQFICDLWQSGQLALKQVRQILTVMTQEAIVQFLALPQATVQFERLALDPILLSLSLKEALLPVRSQIGQWLILRPEWRSPFQRVQVLEASALASQPLPPLQRTQLDPSQVLRDLLRGETLYYLANAWQVDVTALADWLRPMVQRGWVKPAPYDQPRDGVAIACIDDSKAVQRQVKLTLETAGYQVIPLLEPARALTALVRQRPALILMDITMPQIDGYELCQMLRQSASLKTVPIVMLTGRDGLIDRLRAKLVGANQYLTKPFEPDQLLKLVHDQIALTTRSSVG